jgi:sec-independent protein translocase protein TatB
MFDLGTQELIVIFIVAFLVFGPKKLPELGRTLGRGMRELKNAMRGVKDSLEEAESGLTDEIKKAKTDIEKVYEGFEIPDFKKEALKAIQKEPEEKKAKNETTEEESSEQDSGPGEIKENDKKDG